MGRFLRISALTPGSFIEEKPKDESQYSFLTAPDVLPEDYPYFQQRVGEYVNKAKDLAKTYQENPNIDYKSKVTDLQAQLLNDYRSGPLGQIINRKKTVDSFKKQAFENKDPNLTQLALNNIKVTPLEEEKGKINYGAPVKMVPFDKMMNEKDLYKDIKETAKSVQPEDFGADEIIKQAGPNMFYDQEVMNRWTGVAQDRVEKLLARKYAGSQSQKALEQRAVDMGRAPSTESIYNPDGSVNENSTIGSAIKSYAGAVATMKLNQRIFNSPNWAKISRATAKGKAEVEKPQAYREFYHSVVDPAYATGDISNVVDAFKQVDLDFIFQDNNGELLIKNPKSKTWRASSYPLTKKGMDDAIKALTTYKLNAQFNKEDLDK